jgi:hypothetical protein
MRSHFSLTKAAATACAVAGTATLLNGNCSAQFIAADFATNSTYAAGWFPTNVYDPGTVVGAQNGGYGFGPWTTYGSEINPLTPSLTEHALDRTSPYDPFGMAWTLYNSKGIKPNHWPDGTGGTTADPFYPYSPGTCFNGDTGTFLSRAGRALPNGAVYDAHLGYSVPGGGLKVGQTFSTIIANPADRGIYGGYTVVFANWPENISYDNKSYDTVVDVGTFEYGTLGRWYTSKTYASGSCPLFDSDTTTNGMQLDLTVTSTNSYHLIMTPLGNPTNAFSEDGTFKNPGPIVWVTYQIYNTDSNFYPAGGDYSGCGGPDRTDFYIKSMTVSGLMLNIQRADTNVVLSWPGYITSFHLESTPSLRAPLWNPVLPDPVVFNGLNVVTNAIADTQQFYRLKQ